MLKFITNRSHGALELAVLWHWTNLGGKPLPHCQGSWFAENECHETCQWSEFIDMSHGWSFPNNFICGGKRPLESTFQMLLQVFFCNFKLCFWKRSDVSGKVLNWKKVHTYFKLHRKIGTFPLIQRPGTAAPCGFGLIYGQFFSLQAFPYLSIFIAYSCFWMGSDAVNVNIRGDAQECLSEMKQPASKKSSVSKEWTWPHQRWNEFCY